MRKWQQNYPRCDYDEMSENLNLFPLVSISKHPKEIYIHYDLIESYGLLFQDRVT